MNCRYPGHRSYVDHSSIILTLWEDRKYPHLCPIMPFLALAFDYGVFDLDASKLFSSTLDRDVVEVEFNKAVLDKPLFRSCDGITAWTYAGCHKALTEVAYRAGYRCAVTSYAVRRGAINVLDCELPITRCTWSD